jgi:hypothetical protein
MIANAKSARAKLSYPIAEEIRRRVAAGERQIDLAVEYGVTAGQICAIVTHRCWRSDRIATGGPRKDPTPAEIEQRCEEIRCGWDPEEAAKRRIGPAYAWTTPDAYCAVRRKGALNST